MKIQFFNTNYVINKEKGNVTCIMTACLSDYSGQSNVTSTYRLKKTFQFKAIGVAKLHKDDVWDETIGKRVAESKAKIAVYKMGKKICANYKKNINILANDVDHLTDNLNKFLQTEEKHLLKLKK